MHEKYNGSFFSSLVKMPHATSGSSISSVHKFSSLFLVLFVLVAAVAAAADSAQEGHDVTRLRRAALVSDSDDDVIVIDSTVPGNVRIDTLMIIGRFVMVSQYKNVLLN